MNNKPWQYAGRTWRHTTKEEYQKALDAVANEIQKYGYEVTGADHELDCMDIWGYEASGKRRRKCFLEIYTQPGCVDADTNTIVSLIFSHPNPDGEESIEVLFDDEGTPRVSDLVTGIAEIIEPLKRRGTK